MITSPPTLVGIDFPAALYQTSRDRVRRRLHRGDAEIRRGYLGKIGRGHVWNAHELIAGTFTSDVALELVVRRLANGHTDPVAGLLCAVTDCDEIEEALGLCSTHMRRLMRTWGRAEHSRLFLMQLVAMCRWVVERNSELVLPPGFDPWASQCMTPGCDGVTNYPGRSGPMCVACTANFWSNGLHRPRPRHWRPQVNPQAVETEA